MPETIEDKIFSEKNGNFQTMNMIYKIKNIKKKRKQPENMKKMPFPEVLNNIDPVLAEAKGLAEATEPVPASDSDSLKKAGPVIEGFDRFNYEYNDWDGYDNVNDNTADVKGKDPRQILIDFINYLYDSTIAYNKMLAAYITNKVSNSKAIKEVSTSIKTDVNAIKETVGLKSNTESDKEGNENSDEAKVYKYICILEALTFSCFVVNNWYFLMFYNNFDLDNKYQRKMPLTNFSVDMFKSLDDSKLTNRIIKNGFLYFFEYAVFFPVTLEWFLLEVAPKTTIRWFNHMVLYIVLFFVIFLCSYYLAGSFKDFLIDCINANMKNILVSIMVAAVFVLFLVPDSDSEASVFNHDYDARRAEREMVRDFDKLNTNTETLKELGEQLKSIDVNDPNISKQDVKKAIDLKNQILKLSEGKGNWFTPGLKQQAEKLQKKYGIDRELIDEMKSKQQQGGNSELDTEELKQLLEYQGGAFLPNDSGLGNFASQGIQTLKQAAPKSKTDAAASVLKIIWNIIRFLIVITISVPFGALFCVGYFIFYSLYAMIYYYDRDFTKILEAFTDMLKFIDNKKPEDKPTPTDTTFQLFIKKFYEYIEYISDNFFIIVYLITFLLILGDSQKNITNTTLRNAVYFLSLSFITIILFYLYYIIKSRFNISSVDDFISLAKGSREPQPKNYEGSAGSFNTATYGVYGVTMAGFLYILYTILQYNLPKSMQFV